MRTFPPLHERFHGRYVRDASRAPECAAAQKPQNAMYWSLLHLMSQREWGGKTYSADQFHAYYKTRFLGAEDMTLPNGKTLTIPNSTANLDVSEFSDYFEKVQADAAERGVFLDELAA